MHIRRGFLQILLDHTIASSSKNDGVQVVIRTPGRTVFDQIKYTLDGLKEGSRRLRKGSEAGAGDKEQEFVR